MAKTKTIENLFAFLAWTFPLLPPLLLIATWQQSSPVRWIWILVVYGVMEHLDAWLGIFLPHGIRFLVYSAFTLLEYLLFFLFFYSQTESKPAKLIGLILSSVFIIFNVLFQALNEKATFDSVPAGVEVIMMIIFAVYFLFEKINRMQMNEFIYNEPTFWTAMGIVIPLAGSFFIMIYTSSLTALEIRKLWVFVNIFTLFKYILFAVAILMCVNKGKPTAVRRQRPALYPLT